MKTIVISVIISILLSLYIESYVTAEKWDLSEGRRNRFSALFPNMTPKGLKSIFDRVFAALTLLVVFLCYKGIL